MRFSHLTYPILLCLFLVASPRAVAENPKTLARHFFRSPAMENVKISPGNRYLSFIGDRGDQSLQSYEFETGRRRATRAEKGDVYDYYWVSSKQVLVFAQRLGIPMYYGGPHPAFLASQKKYLRLIPGRIVGTSVDTLGKDCFRLGLQRNFAECSFSCEWDNEMATFFIHDGIIQSITIRANHDNFKAIFTHISHLTFY